VTRQGELSLSTATRRASPSRTGRQPASAIDLEVFYRRTFRPLLRHLVFKYGLSKEDASDVVQEAFVIALVKLKRDGNPRAWLTRVVDGLAVNLIRKNLRRTNLTARWGGGNDNSPVSVRGDQLSGAEEDLGGLVE
jgi:DNA-directed RNA polymerase specialized sigma24 family protein